MKGHVLNADSKSTIEESLFNKEQPTKVIVHGFTDSADAEWMKVSVYTDSDTNDVIKS